MLFGHLKNTSPNVSFFLLLILITGMPQLGQSMWQTSFLLLAAEELPEPNIPFGEDPPHLLPGDLVAVATPPLEGIAVRGSVDPPHLLPRDLVALATPPLAVASGRRLRVERLGRSEESSGRDGCVSTRPRAAAVH